MYRNNSLRKIYLSSNEKHVLLHVPRSTRNGGQCNGGEYVGIVALTWMKCFILVGHGLEWAARSEDASTLRMVSERRIEQQ